MSFRPLLVHLSQRNQQCVTVVAVPDTSSVESRNCNDFCGGCLKVMALSSERTNSGNEFETYGFADEKAVLSLSFCPDLSYNEI